MGWERLHAGGLPGSLRGPAGSLRHRRRRHEPRCHQAPPGRGVLQWRQPRDVDHREAVRQQVRRLILVGRRAPASAGDTGSVPRGREPVAFGTAL